MKIQLKRRRFRAQKQTQLGSLLKISTVMSVATKLQSSICEPRAVLGPGGNRVRVSDAPKRKNEGLKKPPQRPIKPVSEIPEAVVRNNVSVDSTCSSDTSSSCSSAKTVSPRRTVRHKSLRPAKLVSDDMEVVKPAGPPKRCEWITPNSGKLAVLLFIFLLYMFACCEIDEKDMKIWNFECKMLSLIYTCKKYELFFFFFLIS